MDTKMYTNFPVNFVSYTHSGNGCLSISLKNSTPRKEIFDFLKKIEVGTDRTMLVFNLEGVVFRGIMRSIISRKTSISFTIHMKSDKFIAMRIYDLVGRSGLSLGMGEEYVSLRNAVEEKIKRLAELTGEEAETILSRETSYKGKLGVKTIEGMRSARFEYLNRRLDFLLNKFSRNGKHVSDPRGTEEDKTDTQHT